MKKQDIYDKGYSLDEEVRKIIKRFHEENEPPYSMIEICREFGIHPIYRAKLESNISGYIKKKKNGKYIIMTNATDSINRRRFTVAHELAHYLLHREAIGDGLVDDALYRSDLSNKQEVEANKLAADILMPYPKIYELLDKGTPLYELPGLFRVSETAMCIRLEVGTLRLRTP